MWPFDLQIVPGRFHSFTAYTLAIIGVIFWQSSLWQKNLAVHNWMGGYVIQENPSACADNISHVVFWGPMLWHIHFFRRLFEVAFVHEYRRDNHVRDCIFAWSSYSFYGVIVGMSTRSDAFPAEMPSGRGMEVSLACGSPWLVLGLLIFLVGEAGNSYSHFRLTWARQAKEKKAAKDEDGGAAGTTTTWSNPKGKEIMEGGLFSHVTCAHFFYEILTWIGFCLTTNFAGGPLVVAIWSLGGLIMMAVSRHNSYKKYFDGVQAPLYPASKKAIIPFLL